MASNQIGDDIPHEQTGKCKCEQPQIVVQPCARADARKDDCPDKRNDKAKCLRFLVQSGFYQKLRCVAIVGLILYDLFERIHRARVVTARHLLLCELVEKTALLFKRPRQLLFGHLFQEISADDCAGGAIMPARAGLA